MASDTETMLQAACIQAAGALLGPRHSSHDQMYSEATLPGTVMDLAARLYSQIRRTNWDQ